MKCPVCWKPVTWDVALLTATGLRLVRAHVDGVGRDCPMSGKPLRWAS